MNAESGRGSIGGSSMADHSLTKALYSALNLVGIKLLDHFVVGELEVISFAELGQLS